MPTPIATQLAKITAQIQQAEKNMARPIGSTQLLAVTKNQPTEIISQLVLSGHQQVAENYLQEALPKMQALANANLEWHFIGRVQSNKTKAIADHFSWVHTIERLSIAERLAAQRPVTLPPLNVCIQVNISQEQSKAGVALDEVLSLANAIKVFPGLRLRGLMALPALTANKLQQEKVFQQMQQLFLQLQQKGVPIDTLSMGTSADFELAIKYGATSIRIGRALFTLGIE